MTKKVHVQPAAATLEVPSPIVGKAITYFGGHPMISKTLNQTTGGVEHVFLEALESCFSADTELREHGMVIVTNFDRERARGLLDKFANRLAVGGGG
jgi:hypothetical protein